MAPAKVLSIRTDTALSTAAIFAVGATAAHAMADLGPVTIKRSATGE